jgi:ubiquinol-cytochrome c reductase cytochrome c1 subunit
MAAFAARVRASPARAAVVAGVSASASAFAYSAHTQRTAWRQPVPSGVRVAQASEGGVEAPKMTWSHTGWFEGFDYAAVRRGWEVYKDVCAACHQISRLHYRELVGTVMTEDEAKELAAENDYPDDPDDQGEINDRPGKLTDEIPKPYPNEQAARAANNGALPADLKLIAKSREAGPDYIFALMNGYRDPPAGIELREGLYYNIYFPGGAIAMAQPLYDDMVEFSDGTEASVSQMAKDVAVFLNWAAEPEMDERKKFGVKALLVLSLMAFPALFWRRQKWSTLKTRSIAFTKVTPARVSKR